MVVAKVNFKILLFLYINLFEFYCIYIYLSICLSVHPSIHPSVFEYGLLNFKFYFVAYNLLLALFILMLKMFQDFYFK